jgi:hypothetical protein
MQSRQPPASNFLAARDFAFAASLFYANITPAALHRGDLDDRDRESAEAAGRNPKFEPSDPRGVTASLAAPAAQMPSMASS